jgi:hypothetical protein
MLTAQLPLPGLCFFLRLPLVHDEARPAEASGRPEQALHMPRRWVQDILHILLRENSAREEDPRLLLEMQNLLLNILVKANIVCI